MNKSPQEKLVQAMLEPDFYDHHVDQVTLIQTHISWVFLTGDFAYKLKKTVNFGFLDFTRLEQRKFYCEEELRLNRRLAPEFYLSVISITEAGNKLQLGGQGVIIDYCVKMKQFGQECLLNNRVRENKLRLEHIRQLADSIAYFHNNIPHTTDAQSFGGIEEVLKPVIQNFVTLGPLIDNNNDIRLMSDIKQKSIETHERLKQIFKKRKDNGFIRECHGDLHLGNIAIVEDKIVIFDCIEFNEYFRWIDIMSEVAFIYMDLQEHHKFELASHLLNRYLEKTGDYNGLSVLKFYLSYRAMVRAKVCGLQFNQQQADSDEWNINYKKMRKYLDLASGYNTTDKQFIAITHGISGSGKSWLSTKIANATGAIHIRSDVERKRLLIKKQNDIYSTEATELTYRRLLEITKDIIDSSFSVIIDATFLREKHRTMFMEYAMDKNIPYHILTCYADETTITERILHRESDKDNISDANVNVMKKQLSYAETLTDLENRQEIKINTSKAFEIDTITKDLTSSQ